jgi:3-oxoacyl-[acyl-carrier-protein] synthase-3
MRPNVYLKHGIAMNEVFITGVGKFLPGPPIANHEVASIIGSIGPRSATLGKATLRKNGVKQRHYSYRADGTFSHSNAQMAAHAIRHAVDAAKRSLQDVDLLATSTTLGDHLVPGFASAVHGELGVSRIEVASFQSVCASGLMAAKHAFMAIRVGESKCAAVSGSELSSRWFRPGFYPEGRSQSLDDAESEASLEFLRWTLSDGAGALMLEPAPLTSGKSLRIDWIKQRSFADKFPNCMFAGSRGNKGQDQTTWGAYDSPQSAYAAGAIVLRQDFEVLYQMFPTWVGYYLELVDEGAITPQSIDYFLPHYSAESLRAAMINLLERTGAMIPEARWFNNLSKCGNTGSASIFVMLEELVNANALRPGQRILCFVPESGRAICAFMQLTVV